MTLVTFLHMAKNSDMDGRPSFQGVQNPSSIIPELWLSIGSTVAMEENEFYLRLNISAHSNDCHVKEKFEVPHSKDFYRDLDNFSNTRT